MMWQRAVIVLLLLMPLELGSIGCGCDLEITDSVLPDGTVGLSYKFELDSKCGGDDWFVSGGSLPPGIGLLGDGTLQGAPSLAGTFTFTVSVIDFGSDDETSKGFALTVREADVANASERRRDDGAQFASIVYSVPLDQFGVVRAREWTTTYAQRSKRCWTRAMRSS